MQNGAISQKKSINQSSKEQSLVVTFNNVSYLKIYYTISEKQLLLNLTNYE